MKTAVTIVLLFVCGWTFGQLSNQEFSVFDSLEEAPVQKEMFQFLTDSGRFNQDGLKIGFWREFHFQVFPYKKERSISDSLLTIVSGEGALTFIHDYGEYNLSGEKTGVWLRHECYSKKIPPKWKYYSRVQFRNGKKEGWEENFTDNRLSEKTFFINGLMDSVGYTFHKNGSLAAEIGYRNNQPDGRVTLYEEDGRLVMKSYLVDGEPGAMIIPKNSTEIIITGKHITYTDDKKIRTKATYDQHGKLNGLFTSYFGSGKIEKEVQYVRGEIDGFYKEYYDTGILKTERFYVAGKLIDGSKCYSKRAKLIPCN